MPTYIVEILTVLDVWPFRDSQRVPCICDLRPPNTTAEQHTEHYMAFVRETDRG